jgi:hypothetical protein
MHPFHFDEPSTVSMKIALDQLGEQSHFHQKNPLTLHKTRDRCIDQMGLKAVHEVSARFSEKIKGSI